MPVDARVLDLLQEYEERRGRGESVTPEALCSGCPELLPEVRQRLRALEQINHRLAPPTVASPSAPAKPPSIPGYEVLRELGRGGMGVVYLARQLKLNRLVALKLILAGAHADEDRRARFRREAEVIARAGHPNIVQVYEVGEHDGLPFLALEYVEGENLHDRLKREAPLPAGEAARLVEVLARAVHAAHGKGVIHRDLKPSNVLLAADGTAKVTDFGLAKQVEAGAGPTPTGAVLGTPGYMAPEQARGSTRGPGPGVDVWALGAVLYACLTGRPPFVAETAVDVLLRTLEDEPVPPRRLAAKVPCDLETVCLKCLRKEPERRYASALELADDLRRFRAGEPVRARTTPAWERLGKWARRRPAAALAAVLGAAALGLLVGGLWYRARLQQKARADQLASVEELVELAERQKPFAGAVSRHVQDLLERGEKKLAALRSGGDESPPVLEATARLQLAYVNLELRLNNSGGALARAREARDLYRRLLGTGTGDPRWKEGLAHSHELIGRVHFLRGKLEEARRHLRRSLELGRELSAEDAEDVKARGRVTASRLWLGKVLMYQGDEAGAWEALGEALAARARLAGECPDDAERQRDHALSLQGVGEYMRVMKEDPRRALRYYQDALKVLERLAARDEANDDWQRDVAECQGLLGEVFQAVGDARKAREQYRAAEGAAAKFARYPNDVWWQQHRLEMRFRAADLLVDWRDIDARLNENLKVNRELDAVLVGLARQDPSNTDWAYLRWQTLLDGGLYHAALAGLGRSPGKNFDEALRRLKDSLAVAEHLAGLDPTNALYSKFLGASHDSLDLLLWSQGKKDQVREQTRTFRLRALSEGRRLAERYPDNRKYQGRLAEQHYLLGTPDFSTGKREEDLGHLRKALEIYEALHAKEPNSAAWVEGLCKVHFALAGALGARKGGKGAEADAHARKARELQERLTALRDREGAGRTPAAPGPDVLLGSVSLAATGILQSYRLTRDARKVLADRETRYQRGPTSDRASEVAAAFLQLAGMLRETPTSEAQAEAQRVLERGLAFLRRRQRDTGLTAHQEGLLRKMERALKQGPPGKR